MCECCFSYSIKTYCFNLVNYISIGLISIFLSSQLYSQITFEKYYGNMDEDIGQSIIQTSDSGYLIAGTNTNFYFGIEDIFIIKTNMNGDTIWTNTIGEPDKHDFATSCIETTDGSFIVCGYSQDSIDTYNTRVIKLSENGDIVWNYNTFEEENNYLRSVIEADDSSVLVVGYVHKILKTQRDFFSHPLIMKISLTGDLIWRKVYTDDINFNDAYGIEKTTDGGYMVICTYHLVGPNNVPCVMKIDLDGNRIWKKFYNSSAFLDISRTPDNKYLICSNNSSGIFPGQKDITLLKIDSIGTIIWMYDYGSELDEECSEVNISNDNQYVVCGTKSDQDFNYDFLLMKINTEGEEIWTQTYGGSLIDVAHSFVPTIDGGYAICGRTNSYGSGNYDVYFIKTNGNGIMTPVDYNKSEINIECFPNPSYGDITLKSTYEMDLIQIFDCFGFKIIEERTKSKKVKLNTGLKPGLYFIKIHTSKSKQTIRIIIL